MSAPEEVVIRPARPTDALVLLGLLEQEGTNASLTWTRARTDAQDRHGVCLVAVMGNTLVGLAHLYRLPAPLTHGTRRARVSALVVETRYRCQGAGSALLAACEQQARGLGATCLEVAVPHRRHRTRAFYLHHGYTETDHSYTKNLTQQQ